MSAKNPDFPLTIFTLTGARSGTLNLCNLFRNNVRSCVCRHEPFFDWGNPTMFGPAVDDATAGRLDPIRQRLAQKRQYISRLDAKAYLETSHAFLKSSYLAAMEYFPDLRLVHLIRDPLMVARSQAVRERRRLHAPLHYYRGGDGRRHFYWSLTGNEQIYRSYERTPLTLFQRYLIEWIEIENRAMQFLHRHRLHDRCFTLRTPRDLNDGAQIRALFAFLGLETRRSQIVLGRRRNKSLGYTTALTAQDEREFEDVLERMPGHYLEIFRHEPYTRFDWSARLRSAAINGSELASPENSISRGPMPACS